MFFLNKNILKFNKYIRYVSGSKNNISLLERFPELAADWHPTKNGSLKPSDITYASTKIVWWQCKNGHEWKSPVFSRANRSLRGNISPYKCPYCSHRKPTPEYNLQILFPELAEQWHPTLNGDLKPSDVLPKGRNIIYWQCSKSPEHVWKTSIDNRFNKNGSITSCPFCSNRKLSSTNVFSKNRDLLDEWDYERNIIKPDEIYERSSKIIWWKCKNNPNHRWCTQLRNRVRYRDRIFNIYLIACPFCSGKSIFYEESKNENQIHKWYDLCHYKCEKEHIIPCIPYSSSKRMQCQYCRSETYFNKIEPELSSAQSAIRDIVKSISLI